MVSWILLLQNNTESLVTVQSRFKEHAISPFIEIESTGLHKRSKYFKHCYEKNERGEREEKESRVERQREGKRAREGSGMQVCISKMRGAVRGSAMPNYNQTLSLLYFTLSGLLTTADALDPELHPDQDL